MNIQGLGAFAVIVGIITTIFWMFVAWRAMRAHEKIAESLQEQNMMQRRRDNSRRSKNSETENE